MKYKINIIILIWVYFSTLGTTQSYLESYKDGEYQKAYRVSMESYKKDSTDYKALKIAAKSAFALGDYAHAKKYFHELEQKDSTDVDIYIFLGNIYNQQKYLPRAIKYYTIVNKMSPENGLYFRKNAQLYDQYKQREKAFELYAQAYRINPNDGHAILGLANIFFETGQYQQADSLLQIGLENDSTDIRMKYLYSRSKYRQKQYASVVETLEGIRGMVDLDSYYFKLLGYAYLQLDSLDLAIGRLKMGLDRDKNDEKAHFYLANAYEKKGMAIDAMKEYNQTLEAAISPDIFTYYKRAARLAKMEKKYKTAIEYYRDALRYKEVPEIYYHLATCCDQYYKDKTIAINYYKRYLRLSKRDSDMRRYATGRMRYLKEIIHQKKTK